MCSIGGSEGLEVADLSVVAEETRSPAGPVLQRLPDGQRTNEKHYYYNSVNDLMIRSKAIT